MIDPETLRMLRCPHTGEPLRLADEAVLLRINELLASNDLVNCVGVAWTQRLDTALVNASNTFLYPVVDEIPWLLLNEAIPWATWVAPNPPTAPTSLPE